MGCYPHNPLELIISLSIPLNQEALFGRINAVKPRTCIGDTDSWLNDLLVIHLKNLTTYKQFLIYYVPFNIIQSSIVFRKPIGRRITHSKATLVLSVSCVNRTGHTTPAVTTSDQSTHCSYLKDFSVIMDSPHLPC